MDEYIKLFKNHTQYETYKNSADYVIPNVSYCEQQDEVHYNPWVETRLVCKFNVDESDLKLYLYFDDFPQNVCDDEYDGDMGAFKQDAIDFINSADPEELTEELNEYRYTGETYEYDGEEYYLWESTNEEQTYLKYLLTDRLDFTGLSLEENINADYCPFIYILDEDSEIVYDNTDYPQYYLVAIKGITAGTRILNPDKISDFSKIEIDGITQSSIVSNYKFSTLGEHTVKYTLVNQTEIPEYAFYDCQNLISINIPNIVTTIKYGAFEQCDNIISVHINSIEAWCRITFEDEGSNPLTFANHLYKSKKEIKDLIIPNSITNIKNYAFYGCSGLTSVTIPDSVTSIGNYAFEGCTGLTSIIIPNSVTNIGSSAFYGCNNLTSVTIGNSVTSIGHSTFRDCSGLTSVTIPNSVTSIGQYAFYGCSDLTSVSIGNSVTSINSCTFQNCSSLTSINIPNSVTTIGYRAFFGCSSLTSITIPEFVTSISSQAFNSCSSLTNVILNSNTIVSKTYTLSSSIIQIFGTQVTKYILGDNITTIGDYAFTSGTGLTSVTIGNSVTSIGKWAFQYCSGLTSVIIPNSVTSIGKYAFSACRGLTSVTIGNSVTSIGQGAFQSCSNIDSITCNATTAPTIYNQTFDVKRNGILYVPIGSTGYDIWMDTDSYYLGWHNWTKVEQ